MDFRPIREADYAPIIRVIDSWWDGRHMADMLPKLFFQHFQDTSFAVEDNGQIVGFLIGFVSQTYKDVAYIHFVGIHPDYRKHGLARELYHRFFQVVQNLGCTSVHCVTSPVNKQSIAFHISMGFQVVQGNAEVDGIQVASDYDGRGQSRVRFKKDLLMTGHTAAHQVALLVIDVQKGMFAEVDPVASPNELLSKTRLLIGKARAAGIPVVYVQHVEEPGLAHGTDGWEIHPEITPLQGDAVLDKHTPDSFYDTELHHLLMEQHVKRVVLCGIQSDICVDTTCRRAFSLGYEVVLAADAHSTWGSSTLTANQIIDHQNHILQCFATVTPVDEITFE